MLIDLKIQLEGIADVPDNFSRAPLTLADHEIAQAIAAKADVRAAFTDDAEDLLLAALELVPKKRRNQDRLTSSTVFFAAVEWARAVDEPGPKPPGLVRVAKSLIGEKAEEYQSLLEKYADIKAEALVSAQPMLDNIQLSGAFRQALERSSAGTKEPITAEKILVAILRFIDDSDDGSGKLARFVNQLGFTPSGLIDIILSAPASELSSADASTQADDGRPIWLCQYRYTAEGSLEERLRSGLREPWGIDPCKPDELEADMLVGDLVVLWRTVDNVKPDHREESRGGIVGWGHVSRMDAISDGRVEIEFTEVFLRNPVKRDSVLLELGPKSLNWPGQVSLKRLSEEEATVFQQWRKPTEKFETHQIDDEAETTQDLLDRAPIAFTLARQINQIWLEQNGPDASRRQQKSSGGQALESGATPTETGSADAFAERRRDRNLKSWAHRLAQLWKRTTGNADADPDSSAFILHIDSPWGGGKTSFANFVALILNPEGHGIDPKSERGRDGSVLRNLDLDDVSKWPEDHRKNRWITVRFNAWQHEHVMPPWWNFYEAIRFECQKDNDVSLPQRCLHWGAEWSWRVFSPEFRRMLYAVVFVFFLCFIAWSFWPDADLPSKAPSYVVTKNPEISQSDLNSGTSGGPATVLLPLLGLFGLSAAALIKSVLSGIRKLIDSVGGSTDAARLGEADPLRRFRTHFNKMIGRFERPVLVIVDDLDRCKPDYVVELVRGLLTVFRSPRVVFVLLGDKGWIETAFAKVHARMQSAHQIKNVSFGGRFVEKAIQLSFVLPEPEERSRQSYVRRLLEDDGDVTSAAAGEASGMTADVSLDQAFEIRVRDELKKSRSGDQAGRIREQLKIEAAERYAMSSALTDANKVIDRETTYHMVSAAETGRELQHGLARLAERDANVFPSNPRRIKRIINMVAMYQATASAAIGVHPGTDRWRQLVLWIILMAEHPGAWRILCEEPSLADRVLPEGHMSDDGDAEKEEWKAGSERSKPDALPSALLDETVLRLLSGQGWEEADAFLNTEAILWLRRLTPVA